MLRRLLLLPVLAPLLAVLLVGALNPRPWVSLRLITWSSAPLPLGAWMALAGAGGAALSAGATSLALGQGATPLRRQVRRRIGVESPEPWEQGEEEFESLRQQRSRRESPPAEWSSAGAGGSRAPGEPAPTVSVPFRVIRRAEAAPNPVPAPAAAASGWRQAPQRGAEPVPEPVPAGEDWGTMASDDW